MRRSRLDWLITGLALAAMWVAYKVLLALDWPWYSFGIFLVVLWALLMLYYRGPLSRQRNRSRPG